MPVIGDMDTHGRGSKVCLWLTVLWGIVTETVGTDVCMRAKIENRGDHFDNRDNDAHSWTWEKFKCDTGCCGDMGKEYCCPESSNTLSTGLVVGVSTGVLVTIIALVIGVVCCMCYRARQKESRRTRNQQRHVRAFATPSSGSLPPTYEMSLRMPEVISGNSSMSADVHSPPSYEEAMAASDASNFQQSSSTHAPAHTTPQSHHERGRHNPAFTPENET